MSKKKDKDTKVVSINKIEQVNISQYCKEIMMIHGANVNLARAIPDAIDGLKPVQRRVLYAMFANEKLVPGKKVKSAQVVGTVLGKYHPQQWGL